MTCEWATTFWKPHELRSQKVKGHVVMDNQKVQRRTGPPGAWHLPGGPVGSPARWDAMSNVEGGSGTEESKGP